MRRVIGERPLQQPAREAKAVAHFKAAEDHRHRETGADAGGRSDVADDVVFEVRRPAPLQVRKFPGHRGDQADLCPQQFASLQRRSLIGRRSHQVGQHRGETDGNVDNAAIRGRRQGAPQQGDGIRPLFLVRIVIENPRPRLTQHGSQKSGLARRPFLRARSVRTPTHRHIGATVDPVDQIDEGRRQTVAFVDHRGAEFAPGAAQPADEQDLRKEVIDIVAHIGVENKNRGGFRAHNLGAGRSTILRGRGPLISRRRSSSSVTRSGFSAARLRSCDGSSTTS